MDEQPKDSHPPQPLDYSSPGSEPRSFGAVGGFFAGLLAAILLPVIFLLVLSIGRDSVTITAIVFMVIAVCVLCGLWALSQRGFRMIGAGALVGICLVVLVGGVACFVSLTHA